MSDRGRRGISRKNAGLLLALAFSLIAAGVVLFFVVQHKPGNGGGVAAAPATIGTPPAPPPTGGAVTGAAGGLGSVAGSGWAKIQFVDRKDPSRIAGEMEWLSLEPLEQRGRSMITEPRFWQYLTNGATIHIQAPQARVFQPDQQSEPESGRLEGGVIIRGYEAGQDGQRRQIDLARDVPLFMVVTDSLNFDTPIGEVSTSDSWQITTAEVEASGVGLRVQFNQVRQRLELLEVDRGGSIRYTSAARERRDRSEPDAAAGDAAPVGGEAVAGGEPVQRTREDLYHAIFADTVRVTQGQRLLTGDTLNVWARLIDGSFPEGTIPERARASAPTVPMPNAAPAVALYSPAVIVPVAAMAAAQPGAAPVSPSPAAAQGEDDIVLTWTGSLVVRPISQTPAELTSQNHLALRVTADKTGVVTFADEESGVSGRCVWVGYQVSTQDLTMAGPGPAAVTATTRDGQRLQVGRLELNLGSGIGLIPGAGVLSDGGRQITWTDQSDLQFATEDGAITGALRETVFTGNVSARNPDGSSVKGDFLRAVFTSTAKQATAITRLIVDGRAIGDAGDGGSLRADKLDLLFHPSADGGDPEPRILTAVGNVRADRSPSSLSADFVEATLVKMDSGKVGVDDLRALGEVRFAGEDGVVANTEELLANIPRQTARLLGRGSFVGQGGDRVFGPTIDLDGAAGTIAVTGEGRFVHAGEQRTAGTRGGGSGSRPLTAAWTHSMTFDDRTGVVECHGGVTASTDPAALSVDLTRGEHLRIEFTPNPRTDSLAAADAAALPATPSAAGARKLLRAEVSGDGHSEAMVETRTYAADAAAPEGRRLTQFMRLVGGRIQADEAAGTVTVPGAGRAAIYDGRSVSDQGQSIAQEPGDLAQGRPFRGSALFIWKGSMSMDRPTGLLQLRREVNLVHRPLGEGVPTTLECERLDANFAAGTASGGAQTPVPGGRGSELTRAVARDAVYVESGGRKLLADTVVYDAAALTADATAAEGNRVTLYDETRATPITARRLHWDLAQDRITVREATPIVTPMPGSR